MLNKKTKRKFFLNMSNSTNVLRPLILRKQQKSDNEKKTIIAKIFWSLKQNNLSPKNNKNEQR